MDWTWLHKPQRRPQTLHQAIRLLSACGAAVGLGLIALRQAGLPTLPLFVAGMVPIAGVTAMWPALRLSCTTLVIVLLVPSGGEPYGRPLFRVVDILLGAAACVAVCVLIFPRETAKDPARP